MDTFLSVSIFGLCIIVCHPISFFPLGCAILGESSRLMQAQTIQYKGRNFISAENNMNP
jgi:hypothetical protein